MKTPEDDQATREKHDHRVKRFARTLCDLVQVSQERGERYLHVYRVVFTFRPWQTPEWFNPAANALVQLIGQKPGEGGILLASLTREKRYHFLGIIVTTRPERELRNAGMRISGSANETINLRRIRTNELRDKPWFKTELARYLWEAVEPSEALQAFGIPFKERIFASGPVRDLWRRSKLKLANPEFDLSMLHKRLAFERASKRKRGWRKRNPNDKGPPCLECFRPLGRWQRKYCGDLCGRRYAKRKEEFQRDREMKRGGGRQYWTVEEENP